MLRQLRNRFRKNSIVSGFRYSMSCLLSLGIKLILFELLSYQWGEQLAYGLVQIPVFFSSYYLHSANSFQTPMNWRSVWNYLKVGILFQALDVLVFSIAFQYFNIHDQVSVFLATSLMFVVRYFWIKRALTLGVHT